MPIGLLKWSEVSKVSDMQDVSELVIELLIHCICTEDKVRYNVIFYVLYQFSLDTLTPYLCLKLAEIGL